MRLALLALLLAGCYIDSSSGSDDSYYDDGGWGSGWGGTGGTSSYGCETDADCAGQVCTRTRECLPATQVRAVHTLWTLQDDPASTATCSGAKNLAITFTGASGEQWGYAPVPCSAGKFTVDKFPTRFTQVQLARDDDYAGGASGIFDAQGNATLNLPY